jgi:uncharacterized membrane protein YgdD (TMEM256/DUF423 family)
MYIRSIVYDDGRWIGLIVSIVSTFSGNIFTTERHIIVQLAIFSRSTLLFVRHILTTQIVSIHSLAVITMSNTSTKKSTAFRLSDQLRSIAAFLGGSGVALGAYGAHGLVSKDHSGNVTNTSVKENWKTAVMYQLIHAVSILTIATMVESKESRAQQQQLLQKQKVSSSSSLSPTTPSSTMIHQAGQVMAVGTVLFSGSIYLLCFNIGPKQILGPTTPIGGMLIIAGWVMLLSNKSDRTTTTSDVIDKQ